MSKTDDKILQDVLNQINKKHGEGTLLDLSKGIKVNVETITTGLPSLDLILGGGIPKGRIIEIYGPESSGKTTMSLHILAKCQEEGKRAAFIDAENAFDPDYAANLGVKVDELLLNQPNSGEEALDIVEKLCESEQVSVIVIDSVAQLVPMAVKNKEIDGSANIGTTARLLSQTLPRISNAASRSGTTLIFINQIRMKIGVMYGSPETTPGGMALKFAASIRLETRGRKPEARNGVEGMPVKVTIKKNKIAPPFRSTELFLGYGWGFDSIDDLLDTAVSLGIIKKAGGWFTYEGIKEQGWPKMRDVLKADKKITDEIQKTLSELAT